MKPIESRGDIQELVYAFYGKIRKDELLGPIFNAHIAEEEWPHHLEKLTDFWETNLLGTARYKGRPSAKHQQVDKNLGYTIEQRHFGQWLNLWFQTIDERYEGKLADRAKESARRMAMGQFLSIWKRRPENRTDRERLDFPG